MRLDKLKFNSSDYAHPAKDIWVFRYGDTYTIHDDRGREENVYERWREVDAITAQAILYHLLAE